MFVLLSCSQSGRASLINVKLSHFDAFSGACHHTGLPLRLTPVVIILLSSNWPASQATYPDNLVFRHVQAWECSWSRRLISTTAKSETAATATTKDDPTAERSHLKANNMMKSVRGYFGEMLLPMFEEVPSHSDKKTPKTIIVSFLSSSPSHYTLFLKAYNTSCWACWWVWHNWHRKTDL